MQKKKIDLTSGPIFNNLIRVSLPIMFTSFMMMAYNLTDTFWLSRVDSDLVAASGAAGMFIWLSNAFFLIGKLGADIGVSQSIGKKDENKAKEYLQNSLFLAILFGVSFGAVAAIFRTQLIGVFGLAEEYQHVVREAASYLGITALAIPFMFVKATISGAFVATGNSKTPFYLNSLGFLANMIINPILILGMGFGIVGTALGTLIINIVVCTWFVVLLKKGKKRPFENFKFFDAPPIKETISQIFKWSLPPAAESFFFTILAMMNSRIMAQFGASALGVHKVGAQVESLSYLVGGGFAAAVTAFIGQNYGAKKWKRVNDCKNISLKTMAVWGAVVTVIMAVFGGPIFSLFFRDQPDLVLMGSRFMLIFATCQILACLEYTSAGIFRGIGKTMPASIASIVTNVFRVPLVFLLSRPFFGLGMYGVWIGLTIGAIIRAIWTILWLLKTARKLPKADEVADTSEAL
ncbi:MAG: MATE family efflux transporter [Defluviitaleaceae bacterium]|nr:MATE family efflux transporter [Defluviitaleaceae bacterium]